MFQLTKPEFDKLRSQVVTSSRYPPYAFTEQGVSMLSSVLRSKRAILTNIEIMRANMTPGSRWSSMPSKSSFLLQNQRAPDR